MGIRPEGVFDGRRIHLAREPATIRALQKS